MDEKIRQFISNELKASNKKLNSLNDRIHEIELDQNSINHKIDAIINQNDNTGLPFYTSDKIPGFYGDEITRLKEQYSELDHELTSLKKEKELQSKRVDEVTTLLSDNSEQYVCKNIDVLNAQEIERQRIARDIHDSVVQNMTALIYKNEFISKIIESDQQRAELELNNSNKIIRNCINELRSIIYDLRPMSVNDLNFKDSLLNVISHFQDSTEMIIECDVKKIECNSSIILISIIRIVQELCSNSIKHSKGTKISLCMEQKENNIFIKYSDDGIGFQNKDIQKYRVNNSGFGLSIMNDRIMLLGGKIVTVNNKKGVQYEICIPLNKENVTCQ